MGAELFAITPQTPDLSQKLRSTHRLDFEILHDPNLMLADSLGITHSLPEELQDLYQRFDIHLPSINAMDNWQLPMTARYIIDPGGIIRHREIHADYTNRPEPSDILTQLRTMNASAA